MNILFVGNSYTYYNDMPLIFQKLARDNGKDVTVTAVTKGGRRLIAYKDPEDPITQKLVDALQQRYDFCILQEQSVLPITDYTTFIDGLTQVMNMATRQAEHFILYATWGRKAGSKTLAEHGWNTAEMTEMLADSYKNAAAHLDAGVSPVGRNFLAASQLLPDVDLYNPDLTHPSYAGSVLSALTHYHTIFGHFPENTGSQELESAVINTFRKVICN